MTRDEILAVAKPILFNAEMVRAILEGRKTTTRRVMKPQPTAEAPAYCYAGSHKQDVGYWHDESGHRWKPPYHAEDYLYVRETFFEHGGRFYYKADGKYEVLATLGIYFKWKPSIHMPKEAARIFLRVTGVRAERLQDVTNEGALTEGVKDPYDYQTSDWYEQHGLIYNYSVDAFAGLWDSTINPASLPLYGWEANPWVWVIEFEEIKENRND